MVWNWRPLCYFIKKGVIYIEKIKNTIITIAGVAIFCLILAVCFPILREPFLFIWTTIWMVFREFFFEDVARKWGLYLIIAIVFTAGGVIISYHTEQKIWVLGGIT